MSRGACTGKGYGTPKGQSLKELGGAASEQKVTLPQPPHLYYGHKTSPLPPTGLDRRQIRQRKGRFLCLHTSPPTHTLGMDRGWVEEAGMGVSCLH